MNDITFDVHGLNADGSVELGSDAQLAVLFYNRAVPNEVRSREQGTPVYEPRDYVKIFHPGEKDVIDRPAKEADKLRFARQWAAYQQRRDQVAEGTPLEHLFPGNPEIVAQLRAVHVHTVQQLASLSDTAAGGIPFGGALRDKAKTFLDGAERAKGYHVLEKQLEEERAKNRELGERLAALEERFAEADEGDGETPRRGGWPKGKPRKPQEMNDGIGN